MSLAGCLTEPGPRSRSADDDLFGDDDDAADDDDAVDDDDAADDDDTGDDDDATDDDDAVPLDCDPHASIRAAQVGCVSSWSYTFPTDQALRGFVEYGPTGRVIHGEQDVDGDGVINGDDSVWDMAHQYDDDGRIVQTVTQYSAPPAFDDFVGTTTYDEHGWAASAFSDLDGDGVANGNDHAMEYATTWVGCLPIEQIGTATYHPSYPDWTTRLDYDSRGFVVESHADIDGDGAVDAEDSLVEYAHDYGPADVPSSTEMTWVAPSSMADAVATTTYDALGRIQEHFNDMNGDGAPNGSDSVIEYDWDCP